MKGAKAGWFHAAFFQQFWLIIKNEVVQHIIDMFVGIKDILPFNAAILHLIPKKLKQKNPRDLRPIALCNMSYKILSKLISLRLKEILPYIIPKAQGVFVLGRGSSNNVIVVLQAIHSILSHDTRFLVLKIWQ